LLALDALDFHRLGRHLLLHDVRFNLVSLVGLRLLFLGGLEILRLLDLEVALRLCLLCNLEILGQYAFLIFLRLGCCGFAL